MSSFLLVGLVGAIVGWEFENSQFVLINGSMMNGETSFAASSFTCAILCERRNCAAFKFDDNLCYLADDYSVNGSTRTETFYAVKPMEWGTQSFVLKEYCPFDNNTKLDFSITDCSTLTCQPRSDKLKPKDKQALCDCLNDCLKSNCKFFTRTDGKSCLLDTNFSPSTSPTPNKQNTKFPDVRNCTCGS